MVYGGALAAGAFADQEVVLFGRTIEEGLPAYLAIALAGTIGYTIGAIGGWAIGLYGGRPYLERHGRWLHLDEEKLDRAERWFERWEDWAVFLGRLTPVDPLVRLDPGRRHARRRSSATRCSRWRAPRSGASRSRERAGRAGESWEDFHHAFRYARLRRSRRRSSRPPPGSSPTCAARRRGAPGVVGSSEESQARRLGTLAR